MIVDVSRSNIEKNTEGKQNILIQHSAAPQSFDKITDIKLKYNTKLNKCYGPGPKCGPS